MNPRRILITGPSEALQDYADAAFRAGWEGLEYPLLSIVSRALDRELFQAHAFEWLCITSSNALASLSDAFAHSPALREIPCAVVGKQSAERARALDLRLALEPAESSELLAREILARARPGQHVLWPRGDRSEELARRLRAGGLTVIDPVAYTNAPRLTDEAPPESDAVFFASPSAVHAWHARSSRAESAPCIAVAIGPSTFDALIAETRAEFFDIISLPESSPEAFALVLAHVDVSPSP